MHKFLLALPLLLSACANPHACRPTTGWVTPQLTQIQAPAPQSAIILLGEQHDSKQDHAWQLSTIQRLYAARPTLVLGFEMFPRSVQPALNRWSAGALSENEFLVQTDWKKNWGFDPNLYLPIFRFARDHKIPMLALNVSRRVVHLTSQNGWANVSVADREGIGTAAPPTAAYRASLTEALSGHGGPALTPARINHFIEAQQVWDRAMAEAIAARRARDPAAPIVAIMGAGHLMNRDGVPHQLDSLGLPGATVLIPGHASCDTFDPNYADALYLY